MGAARIGVMGARRSLLEEGLAEEVGVSASTKLIEVVTEVPAKEPALLQQSSCSRALILVKMPNQYCKSVPCYSSVTLDSFYVHIHRKLLETSCGSDSACEPLTSSPKRCAGDGQSGNTRQGLKSSVWSFEAPCQ